MHLHNLLFVCKFQYNDCLGSSNIKVNDKNILRRFQYNDCLGSSFSLSGISCVYTCFNTTIVWVRLNCSAKWLPARVFQYNDCLGSSGSKTLKCLNSFEFQYNDCLGSSLDTYFSFTVPSGFQYNDCLGSSLLAKEGCYLIIKEFQYNDCLGSSCGLNRITTFFCCFNTTIVWVRHMRYNSTFKIIFCFNTTIVWVRRSNFIF